MRFKDERAIRRRRKNQGQNYTSLFLKGRLGNNQHFQAIEFMDQPVPEKLDMGFLFYGHEVLQVECADSQVQSYPYKHIRDTYVTLGWISTDAFLAPHVNARKF